MKFSACVQKVVSRGKTIVGLLHSVKKKQFNIVSELVYEGHETVGAGGSSSVGGAGVCDDWSGGGRSGGGWWELMVESEKILTLFFFFVTESETLVSGVVG